MTNFNNRIDNNNFNSINSVSDNVRVNTVDQRSDKGSWYIGVILALVVIMFFMIVGSVFVVYRYVASRFLFGGIMSGVMEIDTDYSYTEDKKKVSVQYIDGLIKKGATLCTAENDYSGELTVSVGSIPFITQKGFTMSYQGYVKAGVDLDKAKVRVADDVIYIVLPEVIITDVYIDPQSICFYKQKKAIFNWSTEEDVTEALAIAHDDMIVRANMDGVKANAKSQAENVLEELLREVAEEGYIIEFVWTD